jgi:hypothetical protein
MKPVDPVSASSMGDACSNLDARDRTIAYPNIG